MKKYSTVFTITVSVGHEKSDGSDITVHDIHRVVINAIMNGEPLEISEIG